MQYNICLNIKLFYISYNNNNNIFDNFTDNKKIYYKIRCAYFIINKAYQYQYIQHSKVNTKKIRT